MKLILGFFAGVAVGGYLASNMTELQRTKVGNVAGRAAGTVTRSKIVTAVTDNASKVTDEVSERVADAVDTAGDKIADTISADGASAVS
jgi:uncharacterized membrane protein